MRFELAGSLARPEPLVLKFAANQNLDVQQYIDLGYTHYEVICIGGGGGMGGGIDTQGSDTGTTVRNFGGNGGGGGFHRVRGLLSILPSSVAIVIGAAGLPGIDHVSNPANTTDGGDGGTSSFNGTTCRASGGKGGKRAQSNSLTVTTQAHGGAGGKGNSSTAGGGAAGGLAGTPTSTGPGTPGTDGANGTLAGDIGQGGGGGAGGVGKWHDPSGNPPGTTCNSATKGGHGSYNPADLSVYSFGGLPTDFINAVSPITTIAKIVSGQAGGAKASPLNGLPFSYGRSGEPGTVIVRLTSE